MASDIAYSAYNYTVFPSVGLAGLAHFNGSAISHVGTDNTGVTSDTKVFWFQNKAGQGRVLIAETQYDENYSPLPSKFTVCAENDLNTPLGGINKVEWGWGTTTADKLINVYAIVRDPASDYIYGIDYDRTVVFRVENSSGDTYAFDAANKYVFDAAQLTPAMANSIQNFGVDLSVDSSNVYAAFIKGPNVWGGDYDPSIIVKLNLDLTLPNGTGVVNGVEVAKNTFSIQEYGTDLYIVSVGGMQNYGSTNGANSKIQKLAKSAFAAPNDLLVGGATQQLGDFRSLSFKADGSEAFILTGRIDSNGTSFSGTLYRTTMTALSDATGGLVTSLGASSLNVSNNGYLWSLLYSEADEKTWLAKGNDLSVYQYTPATPVPPTPASISQTDAKNVNTLSGIPSTDPQYSLNSITLFGNIKIMRGAVHPALASNSAQALMERKKLLEQK